MSFTATYTRQHRALALVAARLDLTPFDVRVLVAIHDHGDEARSDQLEDAMSTEGSTIRRASLTLRRNGLIRCDAGEGTRRTKHGVRLRMTLTPTGRQAIHDVYRAMWGITAVAA